MGLFSLFRKSEPKDYESVLAKLSSDINDAKQSLSEIRLRERRFTLLIQGYGIGLWAVWFGLWWWGALPWGILGWNPHSSEARIFGGLGVAAGPLIIWALNRFVYFLFSRKRRSEETHLRLLLKQQRDKVEEIKKATNYDATRKLLEQFDQSGSPGTPQRQVQRPQQQMGQTPGGPTTPDRRQPASGSPGQLNTSPGQAGSPRAPGHLAGAAGTPMRPNTPVPVPPGITPEQAAVFQMQLQAIQPVLPTPEKKWYDKLADSILGDDPAQAAQSQYALVCGECFTHNGLVGNKHDWERMKWICPRCNHLNPAPITRMQAEAADSDVSQDPALLPLPVNPEPTTPSKPAPPPAASPMRLRGVAPRPRRHLGEPVTPRKSRLSNEVYNSALLVDGGDDEDEQDAGLAEGERERDDAEEAGDAEEMMEIDDK